MASGGDSGEVGGELEHNYNKKVEAGAAAESKPSAPSMRLAFNTHRFTWWLSDFDLAEFLKPDRPRRLVSRKFRTRVDQKTSSSGYTAGI